MRLPRKHRSRTITQTNRPRQRTQKKNSNNHRLVPNTRNQIHKKHTRRKTSHLALRHTQYRKQKPNSRIQATHQKTRKPRTPLKMVNVTKNRTKKENPKENKEQDWDFKFNFDMYEAEDEVDEVTETIIHKERANITGLRSRFSNGMAELERLAELNKEISKLSIEVSARTKEISKLWNYYGVLDEFWESIRNIFGKLINDEIRIIKKTCLSLLEEAERTGIVEHKVHNNLLYFRSNLYRLKQSGNFGIEVDKTRRGSYQKTKRQIQQ